jgi:P27 family predicted phage terminase small subunit
MANRGRPRNPTMKASGKAVRPTWFTADQKKEWTALMRRSGGAWGSAQTDLLVALVIARDNMRTACEAIARDGESIVDDAGRIRLHPMIKIRETAIQQISMIAPKLGCSLSGRIGRQEAKPTISSAASYLTKQPRSAS